uniref:Integrase catalytic domain-containing protein n=1 Tax=Tanacetum cinerariifolium TaxID=118510 RepID=A0A6L2KQW4_TANCI|nr:hypothetical protein [Tanacetum cinerariifolium]
MLLKLKLLLLNQGLVMLMIFKEKTLSVNAASEKVNAASESYNCWYKVSAARGKLLLLEVIENGNTLPRTQVVEGVVTVMPITTFKKKAQRRLEVKARSILMMGIPNEHQLKFNSINYAKLLLKAVEKRLQKLMSQLELLNEKISQDGVNQKLLGSLSQEWNTHVVVWSNKPDLVTMSMDDLQQPKELQGIKTIRTRKSQEEVYLWKQLLLQLWCHVIDLVAMIGVTKQRKDPPMLLQAQTKSSTPFHTGKFMPPKPDLSFTGLEEFADEPIVENIKAKPSEEVPKEVKENNDALIIEEWVLDDEEENNKTARKTVKNVELLRQNTHRPRGNMSYLTDYEEIDGEYVAFERNPKGVKITGKCTIKTGLPSKLFENEQTCVACQKEKQHRASCKTKTENSISLPSHILHMDLFGSTFVKNLKKKMYCLVVTDDYSRIEKPVDHNVKVIRYDNETEFKNKDLNQFYEMKGIMRQYSVARTLQQNRVAERRNKTLIEAARTRLVDSKLSNTFWTEAVSTACYVQNRVLVVKPHNKTPYEHLHGRTPTLSFMRPFGCHVTILNSIDQLGTQSNDHTDGKKVENDTRKESDDQKKEDSVNITNNVNIVSLTINADGTNEVNVVSGNIRNELQVDPAMPALEDISTFDFSNDEKDDGAEVDINNLDTTIQVSPVPTTRIHKDDPLEQVIGDVQSAIQTRNIRKMAYLLLKDKYVAEILKKFGFTKVKTASTPMKTQKSLLKDEDGEKYQVNPKVSHLHDVKRIFRYLKGQPKLGLWYPKGSPFDLVAYTDSDYARASLDRKSTTGGCQLFRCRLISWQCKKQTVIANSITEAEYVAALSCYGQVLWIQN